MQTQREAQDDLDHFVRSPERTLVNSPERTPTISPERTPETCPERTPKTSKMESKFYRIERSN